MRQYLILLLTCVFLVSCKQSKELEGLWFIAYSRADSAKPWYSYERNLLHFDGSEVYKIKVGHFESAEFNKVSIDTSEYLLNDTIFSLWGESANFVFRADSIVLSNFMDSASILVLFPIKVIESGIKPDFLKDSWVLESFGNSDTMDFINDSILLYTGNINVNYPSERWGTFNYRNVTYFLYNNGSIPWMAPIKSYARDTIWFDNIYRPKHDFKMYKVEPVLRSEQLLGTWREGPSDSIIEFYSLDFSVLNEVDEPTQMTFSGDTVMIRRFGREENLKWDLTPDGKRIYFIAKINEKWGSGKIVRLTDDQLFLRMAGDSMEGDTLKLFRVQ